jgi:hypothetical protein
MDRAAARHGRRKDEPPGRPEEDLSSEDDTRYAGLHGPLVRGEEPPQANLALPPAPNPVDAVS